MKILTAIFLTFTTAAGLFAEAEVMLGKSGQLFFKNSLNRIEWIFYGEKYSSLSRMSSKTLDVKKSETPSGKISLRGEWHLSTKTLEVLLSLEPKGEKNFSWKTALLTKDGREYPSAVCAPVMTIPVSSDGDEVFLDGKAIALPGKFARTVIFQDRDIRERKFRFQAGHAFVTISGVFGIRIQDDRKYHQQFYTVRFFVRPENTAIRKIDTEWNISVDSPHFQTVSLDKAANMGFTDAVADDGRGGWTDQGPLNDFSGMKTGRHHFAGVLYQITAPSRNAGRSCVVVCNPSFRHYPKAGPVNFPAGVRGKFLYLLHACAWPPRTGENAAELELNYRDGSRQTGV